MSQPFSNNNNSFNNVHLSGSFTVTDTRSDILAWLSPLDPKLRHQDIRERRVGNVGEWLLQSEEFRSWYACGGEGESNSAVLFCYGDPGVGKTFISSLVIDWLCDRARGQNATIACLYFDFAAQKEQSSTSMLRALLKQLVGGLYETPDEISQAYEDQRNAIGGREPGPSDIVEMLQIAAAGRRTFICIDALDECVAGHQVKFLDSLDRVLQSSPGTRIFVTGRPQVGPEMARRLGGKITNVSITPRKGDIISYLHTRVDEDTNTDAMDSNLEADILKKIPEDISETFLLISLSIDAILQETTISRRRQKLSAMTNGVGLGDAYGATLARIRAQGGEKSRLGIAALMWISHAERPLRTDELCHALAVEIGSPNLDGYNVPSIRTLLTCCQGLVVIDKEASTFRLVHFTVQEYLRAHPELFGTAHTTMAETCLSYLNSQEVNDLSASPSPNLQDTPLLEYSSLHWGVHAKRELSSCAKSLALKLFCNFDDHISTKTLLKAQNRSWNFVNFDKPSQFYGLHCASFFGIVEIVASFVQEDNCDVNQKDQTGNTPLMWAAMNGHEGVMQILLSLDDIEPDEPNIFGHPPLWRAAVNGNEGAVKILLGGDDANPNQKSTNGQTSLVYAAKYGHEGLVKILLERDDINPNEPVIGGQTPLSHAAHNGHEGVVRLLLGHDCVDPDEQDDGLAPLSWAAWGGHEGVVRILLGRDEVNPDKSDSRGWTPLSWAAESGSEEVVRILLGRSDVNPDPPDRDGQTPLNWASWRGHEGVVKMLLERDDVKPDRPDNDGQTPLCCAAWNGHEGVVKILLGRSDVNPNQPDNKGRTPLSWAARNGHKGVVKILLGRDDVNPNKPDTGGQTPLNLAAEGGHAGVTALLLQPLAPDTPRPA